MMIRWSLSLVFGLLVVASLFVAGPAGADEHLDQFGPVDTVEMIAYPFLPHGEFIDNSGPWYGAVTIQNIDPADVRIWVFRDAEFSPAAALGSYVLPPNGAITLSSAALGLEEGSPLVVAGVYRSIWEAEPEDVDDAIDIACDGPPDTATGGDGWRYTCKPAIAGIARVTSPEPMTGGTASRTNAAHISVDGYNAIPAQDIAWGDQSRFCEAVVAAWSSECSGIGTYEPLGYGVGFVFDGHSYLPIVQTNSGWNTEIRISNIDPSVWAGQVNVTLIESHQQGHSASGRHTIAFETSLRPGESWALDLRAAGVPDGWVGSAHITSNVGVVAYAARIKPTDDMLMINVAAPSTWATTSPGGEFQAEAVAPEHFSGSTFEMHAPLVFREYHGWNTGISILNIDGAANEVSINWFDGDGSMRSVDSRTIAPGGQEYVYVPSVSGNSHVLDDGWVGSISLTGQRPFHATIDQVKYETGEAMSYMATAAGAWSPDDPEAPEPVTTSLALPLLQRGQLDGSGDMTGIQLFNPDSSGEITFEVRFYSHTGTLMPPTNASPITATIGPRSHYTLYTPDLSGVIPNATGTARIEVTGGTGQLFGVSNTVNYTVQGDGSAAFNLVNTWGQYRYPVSRTVLP
jgi:hypothetical protein